MEKKDKNNLNDFDKLKKKKQSLDIKYRRILDKIKSASNREEVEKYQMELLKLSKGYEDIAQKLKEE